jgi:hypothetical protein
MHLVAPTLIRPPDHTVAPRHIFWDPTSRRPLPLMPYTDLRQRHPYPQQAVAGPPARLWLPVGLLDNQLHGLQVLFSLCVVTILPPGEPVAIVGE